MEETRRESSETESMYRDGKGTSSDGKNKDSNNRSEKKDKAGSSCALARQDGVGKNAWSRGNG